MQRPIGAVDHEFLPRQGPARWRQLSSATPSPMSWCRAPSISATASRCAARCRRRSSRMVGPFVFFDHFGPAEFHAGNGLDVRPHPHIGLATVTYLFDGEIMHRDSLGTAAPIQPGEVNWMTAGRGIVHSERTGPERARPAATVCTACRCGWRCRPRKEEMAPDFAHHAVDEFPMVRDNGKTVRVVVGSPTARRSPVTTTSETMFADVASQGRRDAAARRRSRGARDLCGRRRDRHRRRQVRPRPPAGVQARRPITVRRADRCAFRHCRRRADGRPAPHLVEFRVVAQGPHRAGQGRMDGRPFRARCRATRSSSSRCRRSDALANVRRPAFDFTGRNGFRCRRNQRHQSRRCGSLCHRRRQACASSAVRNSGWTRRSAELRAPRRRGRRFFCRRTRRARRSSVALKSTYDALGAIDVVVSGAAGNFPQFGGQHVRRTASRLSLTSICCGDIQRACVRRMNSCASPAQSSSNISAPQCHGPNGAAGACLRRQGRRRHAHPRARARMGR